MIQAQRVRPLNDKSVAPGDYVLYWMQAAQRAQYNHALEYAIEQANEMHRPLLVYFGLTDDYPGANLRHYQFMLEGLAELAPALADRGLPLLVHHVRPPEGALALARSARLVVTDRGYLPWQKRWRHTLARRLKCQLLQVETDVVVPVEEASGKQEYAAATLRPRIHRQLDQYLVPLKPRQVKHKSLARQFPSLDVRHPEKVLQRLTIDSSVPPSPCYHGGASQAQRRLRTFIKNKLSLYDKQRNDPNADVLSDMSPYLHFGQISPLDIALQVGRAGGDGAEVYLEELIVRRELAINFVHYGDFFGKFRSVPAWARAALRQHQSDGRPHIYSRRQLENAQTYDPYWNAAQMQMVLTGKMHGYMRMYWGKKILEWSRTVQHAYRTALALNDKYELDGRDPNGYTGVAWCFGLHDRPWGRRPVFGTVRYMNDAGLKRKFDADAYVARIEQLAGRHLAPDSL